MIAMNEKANRGKILAVVAVLAMVLCAFVALTPAETDAAANEQSYSGTLDAVQDFPANTNIVINANTTITTNGVMNVYGDFRVAEGVTLTIQRGGDLNIYGGLFNVEGDVVVTGEGSTVNIKPNENAEPSDETPVLFEDYGVVVDGSITVTRDAAFTSTVDDNAVLINNGGSVSVERSGNTIGSISGLDVQIAVGGTFELNGIVSGTMDVTAYSGTSEVYTSVTATIIGTDPGSDARVTPSDLTFTATSKNTTVYEKIADDETDSHLVREYNLNITGTIANGNTVELKDNSEGISGLYYTQDAALNSSVRYDSAVTSKAIISNLTITDGTLINGTYIQVTEQLVVQASTTGNNTFTGILTNNGAIELVGTLTAQNTAKITNDGENSVIAVNGGSATLTGSDIEVGKVFGAYYEVQGVGTNLTVTYITDLATAITAATEAEAGVYVSSNGNVAAYDAYTITGTLTVPDNANLEIVDAITVAEGAELIVSANAYVILNGPVDGTIYVQGTVTDNSTALDTDEEKMVFEVKIVSENEDVNTYTTLSNALEIVQSGTIYLYSDVTVSGNMRIPADVTVEFSEDADENAAIKFQDRNSTLTVEGTVVVTGAHTINTTPVRGDGEATVTVSNMVIYGTESNIVGNIAGAYFNATLDEDRGAANYITSIAVAAANSAAVDGTIEIKGQVAMGDVTFTKGEDVSGLAIMITETGKDRVTTGNITLSGFTGNDDGMGIAADGCFTGTVTDGTNTVEFVKSNNVAVYFESEETAEATITDMCITGAATGEVTISAGTVNVNDEASFADLTIAAGATLDVTGTLSIDAAQPKTNLIPKEFPVYTEDAIRNTFASFFVEGTLNVNQNGSVDAVIAVIDGAVNVAERAGNVHIDGAYVAGTLTTENTAVEIDTVILTGTVAGDLTIQALIAMPGSTLVAEDLNDDNTESSVVYINGEEYATFYVYNAVAVPIGAILIFADVPGVQIDSAEFFYDAAMTQAIPGVYSGTSFPVIPSNNVDFSVAYLATLFNGDAAVGDYENVYIAMDSAEVEGTVSVGTGLDLYIDNVRVTGGQDFVLSVGTHTVSFDVKAGYDGANATITFNGQTVQNGGSITITADMTEYTLVASGAAPSQGQVVIDQTGGDDGMGITDYLLIILVILVIVLAIFVALRMMRS